MSDTLKDFFVGIGFKIDSASQARADTAIQQTETRATKTVETESAKRVKIEEKEQDKRERARLDVEKKAREGRTKAISEAQAFVLKMSSFAAKAAAVVEASALGVVYAVDKAAKSYERLNYMSQRTGAKAGSIGAFGYAAGQLGSSAGEANSSLEAFGQKMRLNADGYGQALERLGVKTRDAKGQLRDTVDIATDLGDALRRIQQTGGRYGYTNAITQAATLGFDENTARAMMNPEFRKREDQARADQKKVGADPDAAAKSGTAFEQSMRRLEEVLGQIGTKINGILFEKLKPLLDDLATWFAEHGKQIADIVARVADDLVKLATAIGRELAGADWNKILDNVEGLAKGLGGLADKLGGKAGLVILLGLLVARLGELARIGSMPPWLLAMTGLTALNLTPDAHTGENDVNNAVGPTSRSKLLDSMPGGQRMQHLWRHRPRLLGGDGGGRRGLDNDMRRGKGASPADAPALSSSPGVYRPQYKLSDADTSDAVVNKIAGEAQNNQQSTDAVINNMLNRVGTTAYGPSGNLQDVATAPGQYAGYKVASQKQAEYIRARIRAIASGSVQDNTNGSNEYRASTYKGPWYQNHSDAPVVGGNRFAYNQKGGRGPYGPYEAPRLPPVGMSPPAPPLATAPALPGYVPGNVQGLKGGGYLALGLGADGRPARPLGDNPALHQSIMNSKRGDTNVTHNPTFNITGGNPAQNLEAARRFSGRGIQDYLRNIQGAEQ